MSSSSSSGSCAIANRTLGEEEENEIVGLWIEGGFSVPARIPSQCYMMDT